MTLKHSVPKHLPLKFLVGHVLVGVNQCGRCTIVASLPRLAKLPKKPQKNGLKFCEIFLGIAPFFNEGNILSFGDDLSRGSILIVLNHILLSKPTIDTLIINVLHNKTLTSKIWIVSSHL